MKNISLLIMAAGLGSRFGAGIKQLMPMGENGETLMEYAVADAAAAGFDHIVYIIRRDIEKKFREKTEAFTEKYGVRTDVVFQDLDDTPIKAEYERYKPWGTAHAVLAARNVVHNPFAVINSDDYYGANTYKKIYGFLSEGHDDENVISACMAGYVLKSCVGQGNVNRAVCEMKDGFLTKINETYGVTIEKDGSLTGENYMGERRILDKNSLVSMNFFGFPEKIMSVFEEKFTAFLKEVNKTHDTKSEFSTPIILSQMIQDGELTMKVLPTPDECFGITHTEDISEVREKLKQR